MARSFGRNVSYVNSSLIAKGQNIVEDTLRNLLGKFYIVDENSTIQYEENHNPPHEFGSKVAKSTTSKNPFLQVKFNTKVENSKEEQQALASAVDTEDTFFDHYFKRALPINFSLLEKVNKVGTAKYIDLNPVYNYYVRPYETLLEENANMTENVLPNFYSIYSEGVYEQQNMKKINSLDGNFETELKSEFLTVFGKDDGALVGRYSDYFRQFAQSANIVIKKKDMVIETEDSRDGLTILNDMATSYNKFVFTDSSIPLLTTEASKAEAFPMYNEIKFSTDKNTTFANILKDLKLGVDIINFTQGGATDLRFGYSTEEYIPSSKEDTPPREVSIYKEAQIKTWDIKEWIVDRIFKDPDVGVRIGDVPKKLEPASREVQELFRKKLQKCYWEQK